VDFQANFTMSEDNIVITESIQLALPRSINEFLLDKARYQVGF
jgi:hypothetical protein